jgi:hypothetical protein
MKIDHIYEKEEIAPKSRDSIHKTILEWFSKKSGGGKGFRCPSGIWTSSA